MSGRSFRAAAALCLSVVLAACGGSSSSPPPPPSAPSAPSNVAAAAGDGQVTLTWSAVTGATSYNVYWATSSANATKASGTKISGATSGSPQAGFTNGSTYYFVVTAVNANGESAASATVSARPAPPVPAAPTSLVATPGDGQVALAWPAVTGATSYDVYASTTSPVDTSSATTTVTTNSYDHTGLTNGTTYHYLVTAVNLGGASAPSPEASAVPSATPAPAQPGGLVATAGDAHVSLAWTAVAGASSYNVYWSSSTPVDPATASSASASTNAFDVPALTNGTTYHFAVTAVNANGESTVSHEASAMPVPPAPAAPTNLVATAGDGHVSLTWTAVSGATSYKVYASTTSPVSTSTAAIATVTTGAYDHTGLTNGTSYHYVVTAVNLGGASPASSEASATPQPPPPAQPTGVVATPGDAQITVSWPAVPSATSYDVSWSTTSPVNPGTATKVGVTTNTFQHTGLTNGTPYYYVVTAVNGGGASSPSAEASATPMPGMPGTPGGVTAVAGAGKVTVSWTAVAGATSYNVYWGGSSGVTPVTGTKQAVGTNQWVHGGLPGDGTTYYYVVTAVNLAGESGASGEVSAVPVPVTYTVTGSVSYSGAATGRIYVGLVQSGCTGCSWEAGTSLAAPGTYTIRGVRPGRYQAVAYRDTIGRGVENATFPVGASSAFDVNASVTAPAVTLVDPGTTAPAVPGGLVAIAGNGGGFFAWDGVFDANGTEAVTGYDVSWGTDANATGAGAASVPAFDNQFVLVGLTNGTGYYFKVRSKIGATTSAWSASSGPYTPQAGAGAYTVSGTVTTTVTPTGPLYVALATPRGPPLYVQRIASPSAAQGYGIAGVPAGTYSVYAIYDQDNDGTIGPGDVTNTDERAPTVTVSGNTTANVTLPAVDGFATVRTNHMKQGGGDSYSLGLKAADSMKQVVKATLASGAGIATPVDLPRNWGGFEYWSYVGAFRPTAGATYGFDVTYADGTTATLTATVGAILDSCPQALTATATPDALHPLLSWSAPASPPAGYGYRVHLDGGGAWWDYPWDGLIPDTQTSVQYNVDGTGPALVSGTTYQWAVSVEDAAGNSCTQGTSYTP